MSQYASPFLVLNLGCEMVFVVAQRLQAQSVPADKSALVLDQIISVLISPTVIVEVMKPQPPYPHKTIRNIIEDVAQSSIMRLDPISMDRLWELITMVFKWQITMSCELIKITHRHLYEIETYVINQETQTQLHRVQNIFENFHKILSPQEKIQIRSDILDWMQSFNIRVAIFIRMGLQNTDGSFILDNSNPACRDMLKNLGENIYFSTKNGNVFKRIENNNIQEDQTTTTNRELEVFVDQILGQPKRPTDPGRVMALTINQNRNEKPFDEDTQSNDMFDKIDVSVQEAKLKDIFPDINVDCVMTSVQDDLLNFISEGGSEV